MHIFLFWFVLIASIAFASMQLANAFGYDSAMVSESTAAPKRIVSVVCGLLLAATAITMAMSALRGQTWFGLAVAEIVIPLVAIPEFLRQKGLTPRSKLIACGIAIVVMSFGVATILTH